MTKKKRVKFSLAIALVITSSAIVDAQEQLTDIELLGKFLFFDKKLSDPSRQSCADCHLPASGWTSPEPGINLNKGPHPGAVQQRSGARKPPTVSYATFASVFDERGGRFSGGNFWDGRATGEILGTPAADQARDPFFSPVEMNLSTEQELCEKVSASHYADLFEGVWGGGSLMNCENQEHATAIRNNIAMSIAAYEASPEVNQFSSKFDSFHAGEAELTDQEALGLELFEGKGRCSGCHVSEGDRPLFTNFTFFNIGVPKNLENPVYKSNQDFIDGGLGARLKDSAELQARAEEEMGKHKTPTLRNVDKRPGQGFVKAYMHNGVFKSLKEVVHFYNARDVDPAIAEPEVQENLVGFIGDLGLTDEEEDAIVAFLRTLSDQGRVLPPQTSSNRSE